MSKSALPKYLTFLAPFLIEDHDLQLRQVPLCGAPTGRKRMVVLPDPRRRAAVKAARKQRLKTRGR
ncbi:hypothetical protein [Paenirhodobacter sp. CAU 1674]|uniref:hypothetical protein n=1 Tax=Paenirhodobacter sp. CAU 1674 TaxID=3032596 RepID=UPI0023D98823|nr:hypothetical protein [Paenirhodobacter sp. CAU 1674]MDF2143222.1 hypothetical protein [Paenirhodobacter sp. CAU 1674]